MSKQENQRSEAARALVGIALGIALSAAGSRAQAQINAAPVGSATAPYSGSSSPAVQGLTQSATGIPTNFSGSVATGKATNTVLQLTLKEAINNALRQNLGVVLGGQQSRAARAAKLKALSDLLPHVSGKVSGTEQQVNLAAFGLPPLPGVAPIVGPFGINDARAYVTQSVFDLNAINNKRAAALDEKAAQSTYADDREIVVLVVADLYLRAVAGEAQVTAAKAQVETAQSTYDQAVTMRGAGMVAGIDMLRAKVELQSRQQQLLFLSNEFAKDKLDVARAIGMPYGQAFELADKMPYAPAPMVDLESALQHAFERRRDFQGAQARLRAAEAAKRAAVAERLPSLTANGDYGDLGRSFANSHGTFTATAALNIPIFQGGKAGADILQADSLLNQRKAALEDLRGQIDSEVRKAFLDLQAASDQVEVTKLEVDLAGQTLKQARDRFSAGVADNLEVVQAQESLANANQAYISSVYAHNIAKASLARVVGIAEQAVMQFLGEQH